LGRQAGVAGNGLTVIAISSNVPSFILHV
jgi:hypothetical protein